MSNDNNEPDHDEQEEPCLSPTLRGAMWGIVILFPLYLIIALVYLYCRSH